MHNRSDQELLRYIQSGNKEALETLYDRYIKLVYSFALRTARDEANAADIVQQVFSRIWVTKASFDPAKGQFTSWLLTITRNIAIDMLRKQRKQSMIQHYNYEKLDQLPASEADSPEHIFLREADGEHIRSAYSKLTESQQKLLDLLYWKGYTLSEIAVTTGEPIGTLKSRLHQSLKALRRLIVKEEEV